MLSVLGKFFIIFMLFFSLLGLFACQSRSEDILIVGLESSFPPFEYINEDGKIVGFDVDLSQKIATAMQKQLVIKTMEFDGLILSLKQGHIDLIISGMSITASRQQEMTMIPYHGENVSSLSLLFWNELPEGMHTLYDLARLPNPAVTVESGTIYEEYLSHFPGVQVRALPGTLQCLMEVKFGKACAILVDNDVATHLQKQYPEVHILAIPVPKEHPILGSGVGIKKENAALAEQVQEIVHQLKSNGKLPQLEQKWFHKEAA